MTAGPSDPRLQGDDVGVAFWIRVTPRAGRPGVGGRRGDALRAAVGAPALGARLRRLAEAQGLE